MLRYSSISTAKSYFFMFLRIKPMTENGFSFTACSQLMLLLLKKTSLFLGVASTSICALGNFLRSASMEGSTSTVSPMPQSWITSIFLYSIFSTFFLLNQPKKLHMALPKCLSMNLIIITMLCRKFEGYLNIYVHIYVYKLFLLFLIPLHCDTPYNRFNLPLRSSCYGVCIENRSDQKDKAAYDQHVQRPEKSAVLHYGVQDRRKQRNNDEQGPYSNPECKLLCSELRPLVIKEGIIDHEQSEQKTRYLNSQHHFTCCLKSSTKACSKLFLSRLQQLFPCTCPSKLSRLESGHILIFAFPPLQSSLIPWHSQLHPILFFCRLP